LLPQQIPTELQKLVGVGVEEVREKTGGKHFLVFFVPFAFLV
jgi:hypothetical protein